MLYTRRYYLFISYYNKNLQFRASKMGQWKRLLHASLSLNHRKQQTRIHIPKNCPLTLPHTPWYTCAGLLVLAHPPSFSLTHICICNFKCISESMKFISKKRFILTKLSQISAMSLTSFDVNNRRKKPDTILCGLRCNLNKDPSNKTQNK